MTTAGCEECGASATATKIAVFFALMVTCLVLLAVGLTWMIHHPAYIKVVKDIKRTTTIAVNFIQVVSATPSILSVGVPPRVGEFLDFIGGMFAFDLPGKLNMIVLLLFLYLLYLLYLPTIPTITHLLYLLLLTLPTFYPIRLEIFALPCISDMSFFHSWLFSVGLLLFLLSLIMLASCVQQLKGGGRPKKRKKNKNKDQNTVVVPTSAGGKGGKEKSSNDRHHKGSNTFQLSFMVIRFFYLPISLKTFRAFQCRYIPYNRKYPTVVQNDGLGTGYLQVDYNMICFDKDGDHNTFVALASIWALVFTLGVPVMLGIVLFRARKSLGSPDTKLALGFVCQLP